MGSKGTSAYIDCLTYREDDRVVHLPGSNFYIEPDGTHVEGEFQAQKAINPFTRRQLARRFVRMSPGDAKKHGRNIDLRPDWERVKVEVMHELVSAKFHEHDDCRDWLLGTGILMIVEGNWWHDNFWGNCRCINCFRTGKNRLGQILMDVRQELRHGI